ncbi:energy transducer TonB [Marinicella sediminis]|uniref:Energy transducer TonB n=1 Tax=Marinicella sediminis TaxID=1792834 RepID=A0ABV7J8C8_9GAMM|nr:TonB family protein [Marinicella sediminis]
MKPKITVKDKNVMTFTLASLTLSVIILGISFTATRPPEEVIHSMDVILSKKANLTAPDDAEFLAQNNQLGGGDQDKKARPTNPFSATAPVNEGVDQQESQQRTRAQTRQNKTQLLTTTRAEQQTQETQPTKDRRDQQANDTTLTREQRLAKMQDEIARKIERYAKKPRSKYVSSSTKAYEFAPYINNWVKKIERTGDLNYPEQAKNKNFIGNVMLTVGIKRDGTLHEIKIIKPSDHKFLDEAAKHIVKLAQPFDPLPESEERVDILYITRTWQFLPGHLLRQK